MNALLAALREVAGGRVRVQRDEVWKAYRAVWPIEATGSEAREKLLVELHALTEAGLITLPAESGPGWDRASRPPTPRWVTLVAPRRTPAPTYAEVPWAPELAFARDVRSPEHLEVLLAVQRFLGAGGRTRPMVPMRERSVELFGDEKRLDALCVTALFGDGRLTMNLLRCFPLAPPLVHERGPAGAAGRPVLVIENHHTWWSFCRWNAERAAYAAVVWGAGNGFGREAAAYLPHVVRSSAGAPVVRYFGDLDAEGVRIPARAARWCADHGLSLEPDERWYRSLLDQGRGRSVAAGPAALGEAGRWLPDGLREEVEGLFAEGLRLPQELVGWEVLAAEDT